MTTLTSTTRHRDSRKMPPSGRKAKTRARRAPAAAEAHEGSDVETPEAIATPSRSSRKRARGTDNAAPASRNTRRKVKDTRANDREDTEGTEAQDQSDSGTETALPTEDDIIRHLKVAERHVNATEDFANELLEGQESVPGYGKIAGRDWAFIIRKVEVNIGRPEALEKFTDEANGQPAGPTAKTVVDIDLGPDRQVSRSHAIISYESETRQWLIIVNGRNGLRVDNNLLKRGAKMYLRNGNVIEIANTQMAFITTTTEEGEGPKWDASIVRQTQKSSSEDENGDYDARLNGRPAGQLNPQRSTLQDSSVYGNDFGGGQQQQQRTHPHSSRNFTQAMPGTPQRNQYAIPKSSPSGYPRGVMMESTETIDYAADSAKDLKPPHSYAQLIGMAILSTHDQKMTLANIYKWIMANYAFYRFNTGGWQNSIRHNLSLNKAFTKIARRTDEPGKGMKWMIAAEEFDNFVQQGMKGCRRPNPLPGTQSTLGSPNSPMGLIRQGANGVKRDDEITPPMNAYRPAYPTAVEAYTPDRGPKRQVDANGTSVGLGINGGNGPEFDFSQSTPRNPLNAMAHAAGSPPALFVNEQSRVGALDTPFPLRPTQRLAPPSTLKRPSDFIQFSSPAPFWKMEGLASTPFKPYDLSPMKTPFSDHLKKTMKTDNDDVPENEDVKRAETEDKVVAELKQDGRHSPVIHSSSPPRPHSSGFSGNGPESPTMSRPTTSSAKTLSQLSAAAAMEREKEDLKSGDAVGAREVVAATAAGEETEAESAQPTPVLDGGENAEGSALPANVGYGTAQAQTNGNGNGYAYTPPIQEHAAPQQPAMPNGHLHGGQMNGYHAHPSHSTQQDDGEDEGIDLAK